MPNANLSDLRKLVTLLAQTEDKACALVSAHDDEMHELYREIGDVLENARYLLEERRGERGRSLVG